MSFFIYYLFPAQFSSFSANWKEAWKNEAFRRKSILTLSVWTVLILMLPYYFSYVQSVQGSRINDYILNNLEVRNRSWVIFLLLYSVFFLSIVNLSNTPYLALTFLRSYCVLIFIRIFCMFVIPLEPEQSIIPLNDPIIDSLFYGHSVITKDLFFSGHVSTLTLFCFTLPYRPLKYFFILATAAVGYLILQQHVHYTVDVLAAPFFAWISYSLTIRTEQTKAISGFFKIIPKAKNTVDEERIK